MTTPTPADVEALARALCRVRGVDPDTVVGVGMGQPPYEIWCHAEQWHALAPEARAHLELQAAAAMVAKGE